MEKSKNERIKELYEKTKDLNLDNEMHIFVNCVDLKTNIEFYFSVFFSNGYFSRSGDFNFREYMKNSFKEYRYLAIKFKRSESGYLNCLSAAIINIEDL